MAAFHGRERELSELEQLYKKDGFKFAVVYGRRRVGKSTMIHEFIANGSKPNISFMCLEQNSKQNLEAFSEAVLEKYPAARECLTAFPSWDKALDYIVAQAGNGGDERLVLFLDEFPYLARAYETISSLLQKYADGPFLKTNIMFILCGSSMSFMENQVLGGKSPLYGRRDMQFKIEPFDYYESANFFPNCSSIEKALGYGIAGGIPLYLQKISEYKTLADGVKNSFLKKNGSLYEEPRNLMLQELREPAIYNAIIKSIANGCTKPNEIAIKSGEEGSKVSKYLTTLISLHLVKKELPALESQERGGIYTLSDNMFRFWYRFVVDNNMNIESGMHDYVYDEKISPQLSDYMGRIFEDICIQFMTRQNRTMKLPFVFDSIGRWWGNNPETRSQQEIDIIAAGGKTAIFGECKWTNKVIDRAVLDELVAKASMFKQFDKKFYYLFSRSGFTQGLVDAAASDQSIRLISLDEVYL